MNSYMSLIDWLIVIIPICIVMYMGFFSRKYIRGVSDYLACGRVCGRYVLSLGDVANALSIITLVACIEGNYKTGFSVGFWGKILAPVSIVIGLTGYCAYRFRETKSMSLGQFLEIRYSRSFRIFAAALRSISEMLANMIMPAVAARFFIQMLNFPDKISLFGLSVPTFDFLIVLFLVLAISLICMGGTLSIVITDTIQGMFLYPLLVCFIIFILVKFSWSQEIIPVMADRVSGESFLNPYDVSKLRDFNVFSAVIVGAFSMIMHQASWIGAGNSCAAKSAHEQKMAALLGGWRNSVVVMFTFLIACCLITFLNHRDFADDAHDVRQTLARRVADDVVLNPQTRETVYEAIQKTQPQVHTIGQDAPLSQNENLDTAFLEHIHTALLQDAENQTLQKLSSETGNAALDSASIKEKNNHEFIDATGRANGLYQQCRTLYYQLTLSVTMRKLLPTGLFGAFCLLLFLAMLSTDDSRIFSATLTIAQDCILPFFPNGLSPQKHVRMIRIVAIGIGVFFALGSHFMEQLDYINLFVTLACSMWLTGCAPIMVFGLYWKKGTTAAAWTSLLSGMFLSIIYIFTQRNWAETVYPMLQKLHLVAITDKMLQILSSPFGTWIEWKMDAVKCPVNPVEFSFFASMFTLLLYVIVALLTCKEDFNMDRMLHRGAYADPNEHKNLKLDWSPRHVFKNLIGITPEYSRGDRLIAYGIFLHSFVYGFVILFIGTVIWNAIAPWKIEYWSRYFFITNLAVPGVIAVISAFWFGIGGTIDMFRLFKDLEKRPPLNVLDDGRVEGNVSLADKKQS